MLHIHVDYICMLIARSMRMYNGAHDSESSL